MSNESNQAGKGDKPRNIFSSSWRNNFDGIDWSEVWYANRDGIVIETDNGTKIPFPKGSPVHILKDVVYIKTEIDDVRLNLTPSQIRSTGFYTKQKP